MQAENGHVIESLLEREAEVGAIGRALAAARQNQAGTVILVEGVAGIGKTRLVQTTIALAKDLDMLVLRARGAEFEQRFAFGVAAQLFAPILRSLAEEDRRTVLSGAARLARPALLLDHDRDDAGSAHASPSSDPAFPILHGLYWLTANLCDRSPALLAVDDAHWADASTLRFLSFLAGRVRELPIVVTLSLRPGEGEAEDEPLRRIRGDPEAVVLQPRALSAEATAELVRGAINRHPPGEYRRKVHELTGGNPFLISELVAELRDQVGDGATAELPSLRPDAPRSVGRSVFLRLGRLDAAATELARAVAILGDGTTLQRAAALAGLERDAAAKLSDDLARSDVLRPGLPLAFTHPLVRSAVLSELEPAQRAVWHGKAARLLVEAGASAEQVANHLLEADAPFGPEASEVLRRAASAALARGAADVAVSYLRRALAEEARPGADLVGELGAAELRAGDPAAVGHLREAYERAESADGRTKHTESLAQALFWAARPAEAARVLEDGIADARSDPQAALHLEAQLFTLGYLDKSLLRTLRDRMERVRVRALHGSTWAEREIIAALCVSAGCRGEAASICSELAHRALADGRLLAEIGADSPMYWSVAMIPVYTEEFDFAASQIERGLEAAQTDGSVYGFAMGSSIATVLALRRGCVSDAVAHAENCMEAATAHGFLPVLPTALAYLVDALVRRGEVGRAARLLGDHGLDEGPLPDTILNIVLLLNRGRLRVERGRLEEGLDDLLEAERRKYEWDFPNPCAHPSGSMAAVALARLGRHERAQELADRDLALARRWGTPGTIGTALRARGLAAPGERATEILREAVTALERSPLRLELAQALVDLGAALRRQNRRAEAREPLRRGHALAHECGALPLLEQASDELAAAGSRPRAIVRKGIEELTPSERRVARMAVEGKSNREIAQALFLTTKTIETHLSSAYRKLGISGREQLPSALTASEPR